VTEQLQVPIAGASKDHRDGVIRLEGGPRDFPEELRLRRGPSDQGKIKIEHRGGYEHFERTDERVELGDGQGIVFRWTKRTRIAE
jgi:hypothetical protein